MQKWEYKYEIIPAYSNKVEFLNTFGAIGWELCAVPNHCECFFKRPISEAKLGD